MRSTTRRAGATALTLAALAIGLTACGSGTPSKSDFIKKADAICQKGDRQVAAIPQPKPTGNDRAKAVAELKTYLDQLTGVAADVSQKLKGLDRPSQDRALLDRYYAALDDALVQSRRLSGALGASNAREITNARAALSSNQAAALARQYGFKICSVATGA